MSLQSKTANLLTICRKAGKLVMGFDSVKEELIKGRAECILTASDTSPKTLKEVEFLCTKRGREVYKTDLTIAEISHLIGKNAAVIAVCDKGFAKRFLEYRAQEEQHNIL